MELAVSSKKGPFVEERLLARIQKMNDSGSKNMIRTWSRTSTVVPRHGRAHDRGPRRAQARAGVHLGADGRAQARRVRADASLPRPRRRPEDAGEEALMAAVESARTVQATAKFVRISPRKARLVDGQHPRAQRARGAHHPRVHRARGGRRDREGAALGRRERRVEPGPALERRRPRRRGRLRRRRPDAQALARPRPRPRRPHPQADVPHHHPGRAGRCPPTAPAARRSRKRTPRRKKTEETGANGTEGSSRRSACRRHPRLEVELDGRQEGIRRRADRGHQDPRAHPQEAVARGAVGHPDPQGQAADHDRHLHRAPRHRHRQVRCRGRRAAQRSARDDAEERAHQHQRDQAPRARREARRAVDRGAAPEPRVVPARHEALARLGDPLRRAPA